MSATTQEVATRRQAAAGDARLTLGILEGDDIGHEIVPASVEIATAAAARSGLTIDWVDLPIGRRALEREGHTLPPRTLEELERLDGWILGPIGHRDYPKLPEAVNPHPILRKRFDLFANVRPTRSYPDIGCLFDDIDLVIVRENNEGFQPDRNVVAGSGEFRPTEDVTISVRVITREGSHKVAAAALAIAASRPRKKLTLVHKDTVFKLGCGMFVEECRRAAEAFPEVEIDEVIVDTFALRLLRDPQSFDTVVTTNMFGDILTDEAAGLVEGSAWRPGSASGEGPSPWHRPPTARRRTSPAAASPTRTPWSSRPGCSWTGWAGSGRSRPPTVPPRPCATASRRPWPTPPHAPPTCWGPGPSGTWSRPFSPVSEPERGGGMGALSSWFVKVLALTFLMQAAVNAVRPTVSYRALALGADAAELGLIAAGFALLSLVLAIPVGRQIDRRGEMPFVILGVLLVCVVSFVLVGVSAIWALFVTQAVLGLGQLLTTLGAQALVANSDPAYRDSRFGTFTVAVSLGQFVGPAASGFVSQRITLPPPVTWGEGMDLVGSSVFLAASGAGLLAVLLAFSARRAGSAPRGDAAPALESPLRSVGQVLRQPNAPHAMLASIAVLTTTDLLVTYLPAYGATHGLSPTTVGLLLSARAGASMASRVLMGTLTRRVGRGRLLCLSTAVPALVLAPLPLVDSPALLYAIMVVAGLGLGLGQPLSLVWIAQTSPPDRRGTAVGVRLTGNRLGQVAIPALVGGIVGGTGLGAVFVSLAAMLVGSSILTATGSFSLDEG